MSAGFPVYNPLGQLASTTQPTTPAGGYALTQANFPCLVEAFTDSGITGNDNAGVLGNITITCAAGWTRPAANQFRRTSGAITTAGQWPAIGTRHAMLIAIGSFSTGNATTGFGDTTSGPGMRVTIGASTTSLLLYDAGNLSVQPGASVSTPILAMANRLDQSAANGNAYTYFHNGTNAEGPVAQTSITGDISRSWPAFATGASVASMTLSSPDYYTGVYLLAFDIFPSDIVMSAALLWMINNPKKLYPGFYKRS